MKLRTSSSHEEGCDRYWSIMTKEFIGTGGKGSAGKGGGTVSGGRVTGLKTVEVAFESANGSRPKLIEKPGSEKTWKADLVLLAMGFVGPETDGIIAQLGCAIDERGNIKADENDYATTVPGVYACGDARRGQSLVVWAISEGREAARSVDLHLTGKTLLPTKGAGDLPRA
jgi:glutamate synthase (NADPH/NADH) small chain